MAFLLLAGAGGWLLWRGRTKRLLGQEAPQLAIAETRSLGNRQFLVVASFEDKKFLLGVCPGRIELIAPLHKPQLAYQFRTSPLYELIRYLGNKNDITAARVRFAGTELSVST